MSITEERLNELIAIVREKYPHRVMVSRHEATPGFRAKELGISFDVIYIRADGWTLGTTHALEADARATWKDEWIARVNRVTGAVERIGR